MEKVLPSVAGAAVAPSAILGPARSAFAERLGRRSVVLVGLMGAGKSTVGRRLADRCGLPFHDADAEIEAAARMPVSEIFAAYGEAGFRDGERRVIARLLEGPQIVLATGGGAYMDLQTRARIAASAVSVWLKADHPTLMRRVRRRSHRPLLQTADPDATMRRLMSERDPVYAEADVTVLSLNASPDRVVEDVMAAVSAFLPVGR